MTLNSQELIKLEKKAHELRNLCVDTVVWAGSGHIGGSLSSMDILTILYYKYLNIDPKNPKWDDRDRFILSKGHIGVGLAPVLADKGYFDKELLKDFNHTGSNFGVHLDCHKVPGVDASTGSLGHGLSIALGISIAARQLKKSFTTYCLLGDGECNEGSVWEAAMAIAHYNITNLVTIVDRNQCMIDGRTEDVMALEPFADKWKAFGFIVKEVNGHDFNELSEAIEFAIDEEDKPVVIIANTIKGCGINFMEDDYKWHYGGLDSEKVRLSKESLQKYFEKRVKGV
ncbi:transketolase [Paramaledivibacter caminithermalis]|jgi:transketolase|uniref:Transketolase n=1 Tax=Paramaledivibacter caminithermalis (strain DSM 15212 / CIP 107654 / DViRD3) TaxID=1121301 RepID=A0A1M6QW79_PARC5|nr:transketolase [Paramaledivibacter caminithermalis]SHK24327.1 transketolase [Paramaledivibacter caminithermalis DSM 15212]